MYSCRQPNVSTFHDCGIRSRASVEWKYSSFEYLENIYTNGWCYIRVSLHITQPLPTTGPDIIPFMTHYDTSQPFWTSIPSAGSPEPVTSVSAFLSLSTHPELHSTNAHPFLIISDHSRLIRTPIPWTGSTEPWTLQFNLRLLVFWVIVFLSL